MLSYISASNFSEFTPILAGAATTGLAIYGTTQPNPFIRIIAARCLVQLAADTLHYSTLLSRQYNFYSTNPSSFCFPELPLKIDIDSSPLRALFFGIMAAPKHAIGALTSAIGACVPLQLPKSDPLIHKESFSVMPVLTTKKMTIFFIATATLQLSYGLGRYAYRNYFSKTPLSTWRGCELQENYYQSASLFNMVSEGVIVCIARIILYEMKK